MNDDEFNSDLTIEYPKAGYQLFGRVEYWRFTAQVEVARYKWERYASSYREAAKLLTEQLIEGKFIVNYAVYPIGFLYRHSIELRLKSILDQCNLLDGCSVDIPSTHDIMKLWKICRKTIETQIPEYKDEDFGPTEDYLTQFAEFDKAATTFKYPVDKHDNPSFPEDRVDFDIAKFAIGMDELMNELECIDNYVSVVLDFQSDMRMELGSNDWGEYY